MGGFGREIKASEAAKVRYGENKSPAANSKVRKLASDANIPSSKLGIADATSGDLPVHLSKNCKAEMTTSEKTEVGPNNQRGAKCERPDVQRLSAQLDRPNTFWTCAFCSNELDTLLALTAHIDEKHQDGLFLYM